MEKLRYYEAREWFWVRTGMWSLPAMIVSVMAAFVFAGDIVEPVSTRVWVAIGAGVGAVLIALLAALISLQLPWMRAGWRTGAVLNGPACAVIAAVVSAIAAGFVLTILERQPPNAAEHLAAFEAWQVMVDNAVTVLEFSAGAAAFWAYLFGTWFAVRRDKYFIEYF